MRVACLAALVLLASPAAAGAEPGFLGPGARVFTLGGGGREAPRDGLLAARADLGPGRVNGLAALPDGSVAVITGDGLAVAIGGDGRLRMLPRPPRTARELVAGADGSLYTVTFKRLLRLAPGAGGWTEAQSLARLRGRSGGVEVRSFAALPDGFAFAFGNGTVWRLGPDGALREVPVPDEWLPVHVFGRADGGFGYAAFSDSVQTEQRIAVVPPGGEPAVLAGAGDPSLDVVALPDGTYLRTGPPLDLLDAEGRQAARFGWRPGLGLGDGGPPAAALLGDVSALAVTADQELVVEDIVASARAPIDAYAYKPRGATLLTARPEGLTAAMVLRILAPPGVRRPLVALTPSTFTTLANGRVGYATTFPGHATVTVRAHGRVVARAAADVAAGEGELGLPVLPPRADLRVTLSVAGAGGVAAIARLGVTTVRRLTLRRARRLVRSPFVGLHPSRCVRRGARRIACRATQRGGAVVDRRRRCVGVVVVRLRPDGARARLHPHRGCRRG